MISSVQVGLGILMAAAISWVAYRFKLLCPNGAIAAFLLGAIVFGLGGLSWAIVLMVFFLTSSGLSRFLKHRKINAEEKYAKGSVRDWGQVLANGGLAGLFVILSVFIPQNPVPWLGFCAALAAANADTWATELGALSHRNPVMVTNLKPVEKGTSGGVTVFGLFSSFLGALVIAIAGAFLEPGMWELSPWLFLAMVSAGGFVGSLADSWVGATIQAIYFCPRCQRETEKSPRHGCGTQTELVRGKRWVTNDVVNYICTLAGAGIASLIYMLLS